MAASFGGEAFVERSFAADHSSARTAGDVCGAIRSMRTASGAMAR